MQRDFPRTLKKGKPSEGGFPLPIGTSLLQTRMHAMPTEAEQYNTLVANLKKTLARGGMSYAEAVVVDDIISILVSIRSKASGEPKTPDRPAPQTPSS